MMEDTARRAFLKAQTDENIFLNTVIGCERVLGQPAFRRQWGTARPGLDESCLLEVPKVSEQFILT
jgi:hypothetical protein